MLRLVFALFAFLALPQLAFSAHPHYERLLGQGTYALDQGDLQQAARDLRLACFGFLEEPDTLAVCLTRLALAQAATGDDQGFQETFRRVVEIDERFGAYSEGRVPPSLRRAFEEEVAARIPERILERTPSFDRLIPGAKDTAPLEPAPTVDLDSTGVPGEESSAEPLLLSAEPAPELSPEDQARLDRARKLLSSARTRLEIEEPLRLAREVADANPSAPEAQHFAATIAYRAGSWEEAVRYFRQGGDPGDENPESLFYFAVSLYEAGERSAAAEVLRRSLPRIEQTAFVREYRSRILAEPAGDPEPEGER